MSKDWQKPNPAKASEPVSKAREAAEALFKPRQQLATDPSNGPASTELEIQRKPRIIPIPAAEPHREAIAKPRTGRREIGSRIHKIPKSEYGRVRALAGYGMTLEQVAALYRVPATNIERIVAATSDADLPSSQIGRDHDPREQRELRAKRKEPGRSGDTPEATSDWFGAIASTRLASSFFTFRCCNCHRLFGRWSQL